MVNLGDDEGPLICKKVWPAAQDFVLASFHVNLDQLRYGMTGSDEIVQCDCGNVNNFACPQNRALSIHLYATLRPSRSSAPERNSLGRRLRPNGGMHNYKARLKMVAYTTFLQGRYVVWIAFKGYHLASFADEPCGPEGETSYVRANVVDNCAASNRSPNCVLHPDFMFPPPVGCFFRKAKPHPHSLGQPISHP